MTVNFKTVVDLKKEIVPKRISLVGHPSIETLEEKSGKIVAREEIVGDHSLSVYENGLVIYCNREHRTAFRLHKVPDYYSALNDGTCIHELIPWNFHLMLYGEDRIIRNCMDVEERNTIPIEDLCSIDEEIVFEDKSSTLPYEFLFGAEDTEDDCTNIYKQLTDKQTAVCKLYFERGLTQEKTGEILGMSREAVKNSVAKIREKIKKYKKVV